MITSVIKQGVIKKLVRGHLAVDGAGVKLVRVLGASTIYDFDPFLMLDSFDSIDPDDYSQGFPLHPHRGIETITYLIEGNIEHNDTLGNTGNISAGEAQWTCAGRGIMHEEMPKPSSRLLGFQLWLNLPKTDKMAEPSYFTITNGQIPVVEMHFGEVRVVSGKYGSATGVKARHLPATLLDVSLSAGEKFALDLNPQENAFVFLIEGGAIIDDMDIEEKTAVLLDTSQKLVLRTQGDNPLRFFFFSARPLREPLAWGGPIVMNTAEELLQAFSELEQGTFIKK